MLDPGAGVGSLTAALAERLCAAALRPRSVEFVCYEVDQMLSGYLRDTLDQAEKQCRGVGIDANSRFVENDFILCDGLDRQADLFDGSGQADAGFSHAILNPPYRKINAGSEHRTALRNAGIETSNLYTGFMFLTARHLRHGGEGEDLMDIRFLVLLVVVSFGVFIWACIGLINPKWARLPNRASSVGVLVLAGMIFGGSALVLLIGSVLLYYSLYFFTGPWS